jgi:hypothetical protein
MAVEAATVRMRSKVKTSPFRTAEQRKATLSAKEPEKILALDPSFSSYLRGDIFRKLRPALFRFASTSEQKITKSSPWFSEGPAVEM